MKKFAQNMMLASFFLTFVLSHLVSKETNFALLGVVGGSSGLWLGLHYVDELVKEEYHHFATLFIVAMLTVIAYLGQAWIPTAFTAWLVLFPCLVFESAKTVLKAGEKTQAYLGKKLEDLQTWWTATTSDLKAQVEAWIPVYRLTVSLPKTAWGKTIGRGWNWLSKTKLGIFVAAHVANAKESIQEWQNNRMQAQAKEGGILSGKIVQIPKKAESKDVSSSTSEPKEAEAAS